MFGLFRDKPVLEFDRSAQILLLRDRIIMHPWGYPSEDFGAIFTSPVLKLSREVDSLTLAQACRDTLEESKLGVPVPKESDDYVRPLYDAAGVGGWLELQQRALSVGLNAFGETIDVIPTHNGGVDGEDRGFSPLMELSVALPTDIDDDEFTDAIKHAFFSCTSLYAA